MFYADSPPGTIASPYGKGGRGSSAYKTTSSSVLVGKSSVPVQTAATLPAGTKAAGSKSAPSSANVFKHSSATMSAGRSPAGGRAMASVPMPPTFKGGPQPSRTISASKGATPSAKGGFGSARVSGGRGR